MEEFEIVVIGGGPAGLSAALYAARARRGTLLIERQGAGGQIALTALVENYPGAPEVDGFALGERMRAQAVEAGAELRFADVTAIERNDTGFRVITDAGYTGARALIYAAGAEYNRLGVPGEERLTGRGVSYCATCDAAFVRGREVAVVGGGDAALATALLAHPRRATRPARSRSSL